MKQVVFVAAPLLLFLSGCASLIEGTKQELTVITEPSGADCTLERQGKPLARINPTPGSVIVKKTRHDITVKCKKLGYEHTDRLNRSNLAAAGVASAIIERPLSFMGIGVDSLSGANNKYEHTMRITLSPVMPEGAAHTEEQPAIKEVKTVQKDVPPPVENKAPPPVKKDDTPEPAPQEKTQEQPAASAPAAVNSPPVPPLQKSAQDLINELAPSAAAAGTSTPMHGIPALETK